jgi:hypothetical protein
MVPVEFLCLSFFRPASASALSRAAARAKALRSAFSSAKETLRRGRGGFLLIGSGNAWRHAAVCGLSDRLRFVERDDDRLEVFASS